MKALLLNVVMVATSVMYGCDSRSHSAATASAETGASSTAEMPATNASPTYEPMYKTPESRAAVARAGGNPDMLAPKYGKAQGELILTLRDKNARAIAGGPPIIVDVVTTNGFAPDGITVTTQYGPVIVEKEPYVATLAVPKEAIGTLRIGALGIDKNFNVAGSQRIEMPIEIPARRIGLKIDSTDETKQSPELWMFSIAPQKHLSVKGVYDDGVDRGLNKESGVPLTFRTDDSKVVSVDDQGILTAHSAGSTNLRVSDGTVSLTVHVRVFDNDGLWTSATP